MIRAFIALLILSLSSLNGMAEERCARIVTLAPSLREVLFDLGLGEHIVGVSRFDRYPPEAERIEKIGGFLDPNLEAIVRLTPDIVFILSEHSETGARLTKLHLKTFTVDHRSIRGIIDS